MDDKTHTRQTGLVRGKLMRLEQTLRRFKERFVGESRSRIIGGVLLFIGALALIGFLAGGSGIFAFIAAISLLIGGLVFVKAQVKMGRTRRSINQLTDRVTNERSNLTELEAQPPTTESQTLAP